MAMFGSFGKALGLGSTSSVLGSIAPFVGMAASFLGGSQSNDANAEQAQLNRDFQANQSGTSYQRARQDLEAANMNPMLAVNNGGASTAGGSTASMSDAISPAVSSAMQMTRLHADLKNLQQTHENLKATEKKTVADTLSTTWANAKMANDIKNTTLQTNSNLQLNKMLGMKAAADAAAATSSAKQMATNTKLSELSMPKATNLSKNSETPVGHFMDILGKYIQDISPFAKVK